MFGRTTRTCAAGLRHFVRPATCKRSPLMGFEVPNVTWATPFLFLLFIFPHLSFQSHISPFFQFSQPRGLFQTPEAAYNCISFLFGFTAPQPTASCAAEPFSFMPKWLSVCVCVCGTLSPRVLFICTELQGTTGAWSTKTPPVSPCKPTCPFSRPYGNQAQPRSWTQSSFNSPAALNFYRCHMK